MTIRLFDALLQGKVEVIKINTTLRRAYTRLKTGKYTLKEDIHPVTGIMTKSIVSTTIQFYYPYYSQSYIHVFYKQLHFRVQRQDTFRLQIYFLKIHPTIQANQIAFKNIVAKLSTPNST